MKRTLLKSSSSWLHLSSRISSRTKISLGDSTCTIWIFLEPWGGHRPSINAIFNLLRIWGTILVSFSIFCVIFVLSQIFGFFNLLSTMSTDEARKNNIYEIRYIFICKLVHMERIQKYHMHILAFYETGFWSVFELLTFNVSSMNSDFLLMPSELFFKSIGLF